MTTIRSGSEGGSLGNGIYLTPYAERATGWGRNVLPARVDIKNPLVVDTSTDDFRNPAVDLLVQLGVSEDGAFNIVEKEEEEYGYVRNKIRSRARSQGYDGIVQFVDGNLSEVVAFNKNQVSIQPAPLDTEGIGRAAVRREEMGILSPDQARAQARTASFDELTGKWSDGAFIPVGDWENSEFLDLSKGLIPSAREMNEKGKKFGDRVQKNRELDENGGWTDRNGRYRRLLDGTKARVRIDIPFFNETGKYVQSIHGEGSRLPGISVGYDSVVRLRGPVSFESDEVRAGEVLNEGEYKSPFATVEGELTQDRSRPKDIDKWTPVGFDPHKGVYFYDKKNGREVIGGTDAYSVGNTVYVREVEYGKRKLRASTRPRRSFVGRAAVRREESQDSVRNPSDRRSLSIPPWKEAEAKERRHDAGGLWPFTWGFIKFNAEGEYRKAGNGVPLLVPYGSTAKYGERHIELPRVLPNGTERPSHDEEIRNNTPYENWKEFIQGFARSMGLQPRGLKGGDIIPLHQPFDNKMVFFWDDAEFKSPGVVVMEYRNGEVVDGVELPDHYSLTTAFVSERYGENMPPPSKFTGPQRGKGVKTKSVMVFENYRRPEVAEAWWKTQSSKGRFAVDRSAAYSSVAQKDAVGKLVPQGEPNADSLIGRMIKAIMWRQEYDIPWIEEARMRYLDRYERIFTQGVSATEKRIEKMRADGKLGLTVYEMASVSAHAMALLVDRVGSLTENAMLFGIPVFSKLELPGGHASEGSVYIEETELVSETRSNIPVYNPETGSIEYGKHVAPNPDAWSGTGGIWKILGTIGRPDENRSVKTFAFGRAVRAYNKLKYENKPVPFDDETIREGLQIGWEDPEIVVAWENMQNWNKGVVKFLVDTETITKEEAAVWVEHADYLPFYLNLDGEMTEEMQRVFRDKLNKDSSYRFLDSILPTTPSKKYRGFSQGELVDPITALMRNTNALLTAGVQNLAARRAIRDQEIHEQARKVDAPTASTVSVREKGKVVHYEIDDEPMLRTMMGSFDGVAPEVHGLIKAASIPARVLREMVTRMPDFMFGNTGRDSVFTYNVHGTDKNPVSALYSSYSMLFERLINRYKGARTGDPTKGFSEIYSMIKRTGGVGGYEMRDTDLNSIQRKFMRGINQEKNVVAVIGKMWDALGEASNIAENIAREKVFRDSYESAKADYITMGLSEKDAGIQAMMEGGHQAVEALNFGRHGNSEGLKLLTSVVPFTNSRIQGLDVFARSGISGRNILRKDSKAARTALVRRGLYIAGMSMLYAMMTHDDDDFERQPLHVKADNWLIPLGPFASKDVKFLAIPTPFEPGIIFKWLPENIVRVAMGQTLDESLDAAMHSTFSTLNFNPIPQAVKPIAEAAFNINMFTMQPIVPFYMEGVKTSEQYRDTTPAVARLLGKAEVVSPLTIENTLRGYFGSVATYAFFASDWILHRPAFGFTTKPTSLMSQKPFFRRFLKSGLGTKDADSFYEVRGKINEVVQTVNILKERDPGRALKYEMENANVLVFKDMVRDIDKSLSELRSQERMIRRSGMSDDEMRDALWNLNNMRASLMSMSPAMRRQINSW